MGRHQGPDEKADTTSATVRMRTLVGVRPVPAAAPGSVEDTWRLPRTTYRPSTPRVAPAPPPREVALYQAPPAGPVRTLVDILNATASRYPDAPAVDDGHPMTYRECLRAVATVAAGLTGRGVGAGDRVGVRLASGSADLYVAILAVLTVGAAYVPVDADDPDDRAEMIWEESGVCGVLGPGLVLTLRGGAPRRGARRRPVPDDDAWIIFTSGSTGKPKGVAITHRSAAAFVDAEANLFLPQAPLGPGDRVLAGLSVAFDASCEEMWLAWRHGACLVPAPRQLVRAGVELGPWLVDRGITVVSTVPTLAALWPADALDRVRLLIFGGEACPPELVERLADDRRELWNTYGPTETTVVACAAPMHRGEPVRIGLPLQGWQLVVLDPDGNPARHGEVGELVIGGIGTGRYLDADKDRQKFRPVPSLNWSRAYYSGDLVVSDGEGLLFLGRADDQVKLGGRRIELGEVDAALLTVPGVTAAAAAVRRTRAGGEVLVGYLAGAGIDLAAARAQLAQRLPAALVPVLAVVPTIPTRTSGKVDRAALPWPLPGAGGSGDGDEAGPAAAIPGTTGWLARAWHELLAAPISVDSDFFALGGNSLATARLVSVLRQRYPTVSISDVYQRPVLAELATHLERLAPAEESQDRSGVTATRWRTPIAQGAVLVAANTVTGLRWVLGLALLHNIIALFAPTFPLAGVVPWWVVAVGYAVLNTAPGNLLAVMVGVRVLRRGITVGEHPRGGRVHLRLWACERLVTVFGIRSFGGTPWAAVYARALGCEVGRHVDLHTTVPVTGMAVLGNGATVEPGADLAGWWIDGDTLHVGEVRIGAEARIGTRSILLPGADIGAGAQIEPGTCVAGRIPPWEVWSGSPAEWVGLADDSWPAPADRRSLWWNTVYTLSLYGLSAVPLVAALPGLALLAYVVWGQTDLQRLILDLLVTSPLAIFVAVVSYVVVITAAVRVLGWGLRPGHHLVDSRIGWCAWMTERLIGGARGALFPLYAGLVTPFWLRRLGAHIGKGVEASTVTGIPKFIHADDKSFLADETLIAPVEIRSGWIRLGHATVGKRAFAGNSGIVAPGRGIPDGALVAVLSSAPAHSEPGSSWLGRPAVELPRVADVGDLSRTFDPKKRLVVARACVEFFRVIPWLLSGVLGFGVLVAFELIQLMAGWTVAALVAGPVLFAAGVAAALVTTVAKWVLVGRFRAGQHPLWSSFVWRNELFDVFYEELAVPWFAGPTLGTPLLNAWLRTLGAKIGKGVWCETFWLPETDLVSLGDGVTVNRGCVLQTHLFHDRLMRVDGVTLEAGASLGPNSVILPGASIGFRAAVGPASLVMRGESVPARTRWAGNPIISTGREEYAPIAPASVPVPAPRPVPVPRSGPVLRPAVQPVLQPVRTPPRHPVAPVRRPAPARPPAPVPPRAAGPRPIPVPRAAAGRRPVPAPVPIPAVPIPAVPIPAVPIPAPRPVPAPRPQPDADTTDALPLVVAPAPSPEPGRHELPTGRRHRADDDHRVPPDVAEPRGRHRGADHLLDRPAGAAHARPRHDRTTAEVPRQMALLLGGSRFEDDRWGVAVNGW